MNSGIPSYYLYWKDSEEDSFNDINKTDNDNSIFATNQSNFSQHKLSNSEDNSFNDINKINNDSSMFSQHKLSNSRACDKDLFRSHEQGPIIKRSVTSNEYPPPLILETIFPHNLQHKEILDKEMDTRKSNGVIKKVPIDQYSSDGNTKNNTAPQCCSPKKQGPNRYSACKHQQAHRKPGFIHARHQ